MNSSQIICPLCQDSVDKLLYRFHYDSEQTIIEKIKKEFPEWTKQDGLCSRCMDFFHLEIVLEQRIFPAIGPHFPIKSADDFIILPTGLRTNADPRYIGKGITICFIDSGFYLHPDLIGTKNRIKKIVDINSEKTLKKYFAEPHPESWHGTMTSVVCAGDGQLSNGLYKGIASDAELVLIKIQNAEGHIPTGNICKALQWILNNYKKYNIRIVNMSLGDDVVGSYKESEVDKLVEQLIEKGITVVAAVGNDENGVIRPPANSLNVIAVGGIDDENRLDEPIQKLYHSSYGKTIDELLKPELVSQAIWVAAPILPGTAEQAESAALHQLVNTADKDLINEIGKLFSKTQLEYSVSQTNDVAFIRESILMRIRACKYISPHYMHVDGTSFAAPIVSSVIAQLLEIDPTLTPSMIREILFSTAKRIDDMPAERQGFGVIQARKAILKVLKKGVVMKPQESPFINTQKKTIEFYVQNDCASQISLAGSFNHWAQDVLLMEPAKNGLWKIEIPLLPAGRYQYKFFVDEKKWIEDYENPYREADGFKGFNSILIIEQSAN